MNYQRIYDQLISRGQQRTLVEGAYYESHHIQPTSLGGSDDPENLVMLTGREHFIAHWLLYKINQVPENAFAWHMMAQPGNGLHAGRARSRHYEYARRAFAKHIGDVHRGKKLTKDHRRKLSESKRGPKNYMFGKKHTEERKRQISEGQRGEKNQFYGKTHTPEVRKRLSDAAKSRVGELANAYGMHHSEEMKRKLSEMNKGKPRAKPHEIVRCSHCGKEGIKPNMTRWHFDNCKQKDAL